MPRVRLVRAFIVTVGFTGVAALLSGGAFEARQGQSGNSPDGHVPHGFARGWNAEQAFPATDDDPRLRGLSRRAYDAFNGLKGRGNPRGRLAGRWTNLGPDTVTLPPDPFAGQPDNISGRVTALAIAPNCRDEACRLWVGTAGGGVWRTNRAMSLDGQRWERISNGLGTAAIGSLELDSNDPSSQTLYAGTGESNFTMTSAASSGLYRTRNGGTTWTRLSTMVVDAAISASPIDFTDSRGIGRVLVVPGRPNTIYVATTTAMQGMTSVRGGQTVDTGSPQPRVGLYRTTDGGRTWSLLWVPPVSPAWPPGPDITPGSVEVMSGVRDVALDPVDVTTVYATAFVAGIYRSAPSLEGGNTAFKPVFVPVGGSGYNDLVMFALTRAGGKTRVYAGNGVPNLNTQAIYRLDDAGTVASNLVHEDTITHVLSNDATRWIKLTSNTIGTPGFTSRGYCNGQCQYDQVLAVPPGQPDTLYAGGQVRPILGDPVIRSIDAGVNFTSFGYAADPFTGLHADTHAIVFNPDNPDIVFVGSDGGVARNDGTFTNAPFVCSPPYFGFSPGSAGQNFCLASFASVPTRLHYMNEGLQAIQMFNIAVDPNPLSRRLISGVQDNSTLWYPGTGRQGAWSTLFNIGDGTSASGFHPRSADILFASFQSNFFYTHFRNGVDPTYWTLTGRPMQLSNERGSPSQLFTGREFITFDTVNPDTQFTAFEHVWRTIDNGGDQAFLEANCRVNGAVLNTCGDWQPLGVSYPFLPGSTPASAERQPGNLTSAYYGADRIGGLVVAAERIGTDGGTLWAATNKGRLFLTHNADAANASDVLFTRLDSTAANAPGRFVSGIAIDPANSNRAWVSYSGFNAITPSTPGHIFEVRFDPGTQTATFTSWDRRLPDLPINHLVHDSVTGDLYAATDFGVLVLINGADAWEEAGADLPVSLDIQLRILPGRRLLYVATHGLGAWSMNLARMTPRRK